MRFWVLALLLCSGLSGWHSLPWPTKGNLAPEIPEQTALTAADKGWGHNKVWFTPLAHYHLKARVLHRAMYLFDGASDISNLDLALGWGRMSDPAVYDQLHVSQDGRWYSWHFYAEPPIPMDEISRSSANTHIVPANFSVTQQLFWLREGDVVDLSGFLIQARWADGRTWTSSLSREDTGNHACELMWVQSARCVGR